MTFENPGLLVISALVVVALIASVILVGRKRAAALTAAGIAVPAGRRSALGIWCTLAGLAVVAVAVAGPTAALPVGRSAGTVIVVMDVSNSMNATDVSPSRLSAAQQAATAFINAQPDTVDIGVVGFNQGALTTSLPNTDKTVAAAAIANLKISGGTSLTAAIAGALTAITGKTVSLGEDGSVPDLGYWGSATIVLFSDGEDTGTQGTAELAATAAQNAGVHIDTVGVGTAAGGTVEVDGYQLHTALNAEQLTTIAQTTGGSYHSASDTAELDGIASGIDLRLTVADQQVPLAGGLLGLAVVLLGAGAVLTVLRTGRLI